MGLSKVFKDYLGRKQARSEAKAKRKKIIVPAMSAEEQEATTSILEKKIVMNRLVNSTTLAFGVSKEMEIEIAKKMIAVAKIYPKYSTIAEVLLNCSDRFTEMERLCGLFMLGRIQGQAAFLRKFKMKLKYSAVTMPIEAALLAILSKDVLVEDAILNKIMAGNK